MADAISHRPHRKVDAFLQKDVSIKTLAAFLFASMMSIAGLVFINADQTYVMVDILDYPRNMVGDAAGTLAFADESLSLLLVPLWGAVSDQMQRKWVLGGGLLLMSASTLLHPWSFSVFPNYSNGASFVRLFFTSILACRLLFAVGASAATATMTALIGDFAAEGGRSRLAGITGFATGIGALISALLLTRIPAMLDRSEACRNLIRPLARHSTPGGGAALIVSFAATALLLLVAAISTFLFCSYSDSSVSPQSVTDQTQSSDADDAGVEKPNRQVEQKKMPFAERLRIGVSAMRNPIILLAYLSGFVARADSIALHLFVAPWINRYMVSIGQCPTQVSVDVLAYCAPAKRLASSLMGTAHLAMLLGAPFFGIFCDRIGPSKAIVIPAITGAISFSILALLKSPADLLMYIAMALAGFSDIGMIVASMALMSEVSTPQHRGALAGTYSFFGALGIIVTSKLGGLLFDHVREGAAFSIVAASSFVLVAGHFFLYLYRRRSL